MNFIKRFNEHRPGEGTVSIAWMGQAGFLLKNSENNILALDVYLSDLVEKEGGPKRIMAPLCDAEEIQANVILVTHKHSDHLDMESIPVWLENGAHLCCCEESEEICRAAGLPGGAITGMKIGDSVELFGYKIEAVFADHGDTAPKAVGYLIETNGVTIYCTGDTSYQQDRMRPVTERNIDVLLLPINGEYGNMNEEDAAMLAAQTQAKLTIPSHFWTFVRHKGNPYEFSMAMRELAQTCEFYVMGQGEIIDVDKTGKL